MALDIFSKCGRRYMAEILPIRRKTPSNQSINQSTSVAQIKDETISTAYATVSGT